jgi:hypothetical protein
MHRALSASAECDISRVYEFCLKDNQHGQAMVIVVTSPLLL